MAVSRKTPVAERKIEFGPEDIRKNPYMVHTSDDIKTEGDWENLAREGLTIVDGWHFAQYTEEYPIVKYQCNKRASGYGKYETRLNSFILSITVSTAMYGKKFWLGGGEMSDEKTDCATVVYYIDHSGIKHAVLNPDIFCFLLEKPNLVVSPEGVLIFYTADRILATVDCDHYYWISDEINTKEKTVKFVGVSAGFCIIRLQDNKGGEEDYKLEFGFDITEFQMLCPKVCKS